MTKRARVVAAPRVVNVEDLRRLARRRLPRVVFDYLDGGAEGEVTLRENRRAFEAVTFRPRHAVGSSDADLRTTVLGTPVALPVLLAPVGYSRVMHVDGEPAAARAAAAAGTVYILSTMSGYPLEDVKAAAGGGAVWYQLYLIGGRDAAEAAIARARAAGYAALVVTIDTAVAGLRERDVKNGMTELLGDRPLARLPFLPQLLRHPSWLAAFLLRGGVPPLANVVLPGQGPMPLVDVATALA
ncbi:MAG TPA: alpha-hydroxy acid oxidase, partial [Gemmatimonadales bacterium]|nr:alpha-hydroxy acid oxidase [Gemmatimonadales bacterium]